MSGEDAPASTSTQPDPGDTQRQPPQSADDDAASPGLGNDTDYPAGVWMARLDRVRRFLPRSLYFWVSARLGARFGDEYHWRNSDDKENDRGIPPPDERIAWHGAWIASLPAVHGGNACHRD